MRDAIFEETYDLGGRRFYKRLNLETGETVLQVDDEALSIDQWNRYVNQFFPMSLKSQHASGLIRCKERSRIRSLARLVVAEQPKVAADIGCEAGHIAALILPHVETLYCVDGDPAMVAEATHRLGADRAQAVVSDILAIDLPDNACDAVLAASILEHVVEPERAVAELKRITRPGGRLVISVPYDLAVVRIKRLLRAFGLGRILGPLAKGLAMGHVQLYTGKRFVKIASAAGTVLRSGLLPPFFLDYYAVLRRSG